jgi:hypothetical protein
MPPSVRRACGQAGSPVNAEPFWVESGHKQVARPASGCAPKSPTDSNVARFMDFLTKDRADRERLVIGIQALGEMKRDDEIYHLLAAAPVETVLKDDTYVLFRPWLANARSDPRFMMIAKRLGLMSYWQKSGRWPDFLFRSGS